MGPGPSCDVQAVFSTYNCTACHDATPGLEGGGLNLLSEGLAERLVNQPSQMNNCSQELLINTANPDASIMLRVLDPERFAEHGNPSCQVPRMPLGPNHVTRADVNCLEAWVRDLATHGGGGPIQTPAPFDPASTESAVAKVKYLLDGAGMTDDELNLARGEHGALDQEALKTLIDQWMWAAPGVLSEHFELKLNMFLQLTLNQHFTEGRAWSRYQSQLGLRSHNQTPGIAAGAWVQLLPEIFLGTARDIVTEGRDFREVVTTRRWRVNTAALVALVNADKPETWIPGTDRSSGTLHYFAHIEAQDSTDWRYITLAQASENQPADFDYENTAALAAALRAIPDGGTIHLRAPRVGFITSFTFFEHWETTVDNDFRVNASQDMLAAPH